ncbi:transporter [bacterium]|nr:transporter [bacterium]
MLTTYDYIVLFFYFVFMFGIGVVVRNMNKDSSDYFRGGGSMVWWIVGATAFMTQFSAWTFTGAAGKAYVDGTIIAVIFFGNAAGYLVNWGITAARFRSMRTTTPLEAVRDRFGAGNEQIFTWLQLPISFFYAAIWLNGLAIFSSQAFEMDTVTTIWAVGILVVFISVSGGAWAVVASDFIQMVLLMAVAVLIAVLTLADSRVGGFSGFVDRVPSSHFNWTETANSNIVWMWVTATIIAQIIKTNSMLDSYRYLCAKDGGHARKAAAFAAFLMIVGPFIWFIPPMAAAIIEPNLASAFPALKNPQEGAYIFMASQTVPSGMMGLLVCGIFAATMSSMDSGLNRNAGIFVKSVYKPLLRKQAGEGELLFVGKFVSLLFGIVIILLTLVLNANQELDLFNTMVLFGGLVAVPYAMPLLLGVFIKNVPAWGAWTTVVVGFIVGVVVEGLKFGPFDIGKLDPGVFGFGALTKREAADFSLIAGIAGNTLFCTTWFIGTTLFYKYAPEKYRKNADEFFERMSTPVNYAKEIGKGTDDKQGKMLARMCYIYGGFVALLAFVFPNSIGGRICFIVVGGIIVAVGAALHWSAIRFAKSVLKEAQVDAAVSPVTTG